MTEFPLLSFYLLHEVCSCQIVIAHLFSHIEKSAYDTVSKNTIQAHQKIQPGARLSAVNFSPPLLVISDSLWLFPYSSSSFVWLISPNFHSKQNRLSKSALNVW